MSLTCPLCKKFLSFFFLSTTTRLLWRRTPAHRPGIQRLLRVPRHANNDPEFIAASLESLGLRHDRLLDLAEAVADEDPFAALRLLQVY